MNHLGRTEKLHFIDNSLPNVSTDDKSSLGQINMVISLNDIYIVLVVPESLDFSRSLYPYK